MHTYLCLDDVFYCLMMVYKTKHLEFTGEFNKGLLRLTALHILILICHSTSGWPPLKLCYLV